MPPKVPGVIHPKLHHAKGVPPPQISESVKRARQVLRAVNVDETQPGNIAAAKDILVQVNKKKKQAIEHILNLRQENIGQYSVAEIHLCDQLHRYSMFVRNLVATVKVSSAFARYLAHPNIVGLESADWGLYKGTLASKLDDITMMSTASTVNTYVCQFIYDTTADGQRKVEIEAVFTIAFNRGVLQGRNDPGSKTLTRVTRWLQCQARLPPTYKVLLTLMETGTDLDVVRRAVCLNEPQGSILKDIFQLSSLSEMIEAQTRFSQEAKALNASVNSDGQLVCSLSGPDTLAVIQRGGDAFFEKLLIRMGEQAFINVNQKCEDILGPEFINVFDAWCSHMDVARGDAVWMGLKHCLDVQIGEAAWPSEALAKRLTHIPGTAKKKISKFCVKSHEYQQSQFSTKLDLLAEAMMNEDENAVHAIVNDFFKPKRNDLGMHGAYAGFAVLLSDVWCNINDAELQPRTKAAIQEHIEQADCYILSEPRCTKAMNNVRQAFVKSLELESFNAIDAAVSAGDLGLARATYNTLNSELSFIFPSVKALCLRKIHQAEQNQQGLEDQQQPADAQVQIVAAAQMPVYLMGIGQNPPAENVVDENVAEIVAADVEMPIVAAFVE